MFILGKGAYGAVVSVEDTVTNQTLAIKKVAHVCDQIEEGKRILREIRILQFCDHPNILKLVDLVPPRSYSTFEDMYLVNEYVDTDLDRVINSHQPLTNDHLQLFMYQLFKGVYYLHSAGIIHRDLKPSNILTTTDCTLKICDFGLARSAQVDEEGALSEYVVTRYYRAPEVMLSSCVYSYAVDIWSCGCIMAEIINRRVLFKGMIPSSVPHFIGDDYMGQLKLILSTLGHIPEEDLAFITNEKGRLFVERNNNGPKIDWQKKFPTIPPAAVDLLSHLLEFNPDKRYTAKQCLEHEYFDDIREKETEITAPKLYKDTNRTYNRAELKYAFLEEIIHYHPEYYQMQLDGKNEQRNSHDDVRA